MSEEYFSEIDKKLKLAYTSAEKARKKGLDPEEKADIPVARNMAERVEGLISAVAPQLVGSGISKRIQELEKKYGLLAWEVALVIAEEVANEKFCKFKDKKEAMEVGIRTGFAYHTVGVVAAPLEGFIELKIKKRNDGKEYLSACYAGPIRGAGGTAAAVSLIITDHIRKKMGYDEYDPTDEEAERYVTELEDYHERVTNLQYSPSREETRFLIKHCPIEINGDPTERIEASNHKDLPRVETNRVRGGVCLVLSMLALKAPKLWKELSRWGKDFGLDWSFLKDFLELQKKTKAHETTEAKDKLSPDYTYISDLVAGRPVLSAPMRAGGLRLRYGRARTSGFSAVAIHPATMIALQKYIATGTQLKMERPGKAAVVSPCDTIEGPTVLLNSGTVLQLDTETKAKQLSKEIKEIIFLGDILINYGDFFDRAHPLAPAGYCEEWHMLELEKATVDTFGGLDTAKLAEFLQLDQKMLEELMKNPLTIKPSAKTALTISKKLRIPLHPAYTYFWNQLSTEELKTLIEWLSKATTKQENLILPMSENKKILEKIGLPHEVASNEFIIIDKEHTLILQNILSKKEPLNESIKTLEALNKISEVKIRDKLGTSIGARMGRPEKAKMRKLTGSPHVLFPVGEQGGRLRCFQTAVEKGIVKADFPIRECSCGTTIYKTCQNCGKKTKQLYYCRTCGITRTEECRHGKATPYKEQELNIKEYFNNALKTLNTRNCPDMIKGVRGTSNKTHIPEHLAKGILRAKHGINVNKDGTTRYDMTELPITHFKPSEIRTDIEKLKELGYDKDIKGETLTNKEQILELKPQDIILPASKEATDETADSVLFRIANFVDELLTKLYEQEPFYNLKTKEDLTGHLVIGLAPHTSAGIVGRIIGFSQNQTLMAHPMFHAAMRRDCLEYNTTIPVYENNIWKIMKIGEIVEELNPTEKVDSFGTLLKRIKNMKTISINPKNNKPEIVNVKAFTKHTPTQVLEVKTRYGRKIKLTYNHKVFVLEDKKFVEKRAYELKKGDKLISPHKRILEKLIKTPKQQTIKTNLDKDFTYLPVEEVKPVGKKTTYCMETENHTILANNLLLHNCDGDEACVILLMDALLNFSRQYLPDKRGGRTMDSCLVLTSKLVPAEVDDMVHKMDVVWNYPLELYEAALNYKMPWEIKIEQLSSRLNTEKQYSDFGYTHPTTNINAGVNCSAYKLLPTMEEKIKGQMLIAEQVRAVDASEVAKLVIEKHLLKDIKGNLRKFSIQQFRCVDCNKKYRRPPLIGICDCGGKLMFTISEGSIVKYLEPAISLAQKYNVEPYVKQSLELTKLRVEEVFGRETEKQEALGRWFG